MLQSISGDRHLDFARYIRDPERFTFWPWVQADLKYRSEAIMAQSLIPVYPREARFGDGIMVNGKTHVPTPVDRDCPLIAAWRIMESRGRMRCLRLVMRGILGMGMLLPEIARCLGGFQHPMNGEVITPLRLLVQ